MDVDYPVEPCTVLFSVDEVLWNRGNTEDESTTTTSFVPSPHDHQSGVIFIFGRRSEKIQEPGIPTRRLIEAIENNPHAKNSLYYYDCPDIRGDPGPSGFGR